MARHLPVNQQSKQRPINLYLNVNPTTVGLTLLFVSQNNYLNAQ